MVQTTTTGDAVLKEYYLPTLRKQFNDSFPLLQAVASNTTDFEGRRAILSLHTGRSGGVGAGAEMQDLPTAGYQRTAEERISVRRQRARIQVSVDAMKAMKSDAGSFVRAVDLETRGIVNDAKFDVSRQLFGTSDGVIVAVDDARIAEEVESFGGRWVMTDPNCASGTDRIAEVAENHCLHIDGRT